MQPRSAKPDTTPDAERIVIERLQAMTPAERLGVAIGMSRAVRELALAGIRKRHPGASDREILMRLAIVLHGPELAVAAYPEIAGLDAR